MLPSENNLGVNAARRGWSPFWVGALLAAGTVAVFSSVANCGFTMFDDPVYVTENRRVLAGLSWENVRWSFANLEAAFWHPLTWLSYMLDVSLFGKGAAAMHCTNLLLHTASTVLLFALLRRMTGAPWRSAMVAALFAVHPLHVESVAWIAERKDVLSTVFWMLTLWAYVSHVQGRKTFNLKRSAFRSSGYWLALLFFFCGIMSKTMVVTLPVVMLLLDWWPLNRIRDSEFGIRNLKNLIVEKIPFFAMAFGGGVLTIYAEKSGGAVTPVEHLSVVVRFANAAISSMVYLAKIFWPTNLAVFYPYPKTFWLVTVLGAALGVLVLTVVAFWLGRRRPYVLFGWLWYGVTLSPVSGLIQVGAHARADRYTYVPLIGVFVILVWGAEEILARWGRVKWLGGAVAVAALAACGLLTRHQIGFWMTNETLFRHAADATGNNEVASNNLGDMLFADKKYAEAEACFEASLRINPDSGEANNNLGVIFLTQNKLDDALTHFQAALRVNPDNAQAHGNVGNIFNLRKQYAAATVEYEKALRLKADYPQAHNNLGAAYELLGRRTEAVEQYRLALQYDPAYPDAHKNLGFILTSEKQFVQALPHLRSALHEWPDDPRLQYNLGLTLAGLGQLSEAVTHFETALRAVPQDAAAHFNLASVHARMGDSAAAARHYAEAVRLKPDYSEAHNELGVLLAREKKFAEAAAQFREAAKTKPGDANTLYNFGKALAGSGDFAGAIEQLKKVVSLQPDDADAHYELGAALAASGRRDTAAAEFRQVLRLHPGDSDALQRLQDIGAQ